MLKGTLIESFKSIKQDYKKIMLSSFDVTKMFKGNFKQYLAPLILLLE
jgi:hypothetical protein